MESPTYQFDLKSAPCMDVFRGQALFYLFMAKLVNELGYRDGFWSESTVGQHATPLTLNCKRFLMLGHQFRWLEWSEEWLSPLVHRNVNRWPPTHHYALFTMSTNAEYDLKSALGGKKVGSSEEWPHCFYNVDLKSAWSDGFCPSGVCEGVTVAV
jgi:hypothetical protein